jgi:hypothetical protein
MYFSPYVKPVEQHAQTLGQNSPAKPSSISATTEDMGYFYTMQTYNNILPAR